MNLYRIKNWKKNINFCFATLKYYGEAPSGV